MIRNYYESSIVNRPKNLILGRRITHNSLLLLTGPHD